METVKEQKHFGCMKKREIILVLWKTGNSGQETSSFLLNLYGCRQVPRQDPPLSVQC